MSDIAQKILEVAPHMNKEVAELLSAEIGRVHTLVIQGLIACGGGFLFLLTLILKTPGTVEKGIKEDLDRIGDSLDEIKNFLLGTFEQKGAITKLHELEKEVNKLKGGSK